MAEVYVDAPVKEDSAPSKDAYKNFVLSSAPYIDEAGNRREATTDRMDNREVVGSVMINEGLVDLFMEFLAPLVGFAVGYSSTYGKKSKREVRMEQQAAAQHEGGGGNSNANIGDINVYCGKTCTEGSAEQYVPSGARIPVIRTGVYSADVADAEHIASIEGILRLNETAHRHKTGKYALDLAKGGVNADALELVLGRTYEVGSEQRFGVLLPLEGFETEGRGSTRVRSQKSLDDYQ